MAYFSLNEYLKAQFGTKTYKLALSGPFTCPTRDGTKGEGGCIFCSGGSGNFAESASLDIPTQLARAKARVAAKVKNVSSPRYIAYFQAYTSTYAPLSVLRPLFEAALDDAEVVALSIGTRPDCLPEEVLDLLGELNQKKPVWVELGLQTASEEVAKWFHRGYDNRVFSEAVKRLHARGIQVIVHLILGFPQESHEDEIQSVRFVSECGVDGIKLQLLHVLKNTPLAEMDYTPLSREEYVFRVCDLLRYIPENIVIHRLTGDGDKKELLAPMWSADKKAVWNAIQKELREKKIRQGEALKNKTRQNV